MKNYKVGDKIKFTSEKHLYTIQACNLRYLICTKPFNPKKTVLYTIVDLESKVRGPNNLVFNMYDYSKKEDCEESLRDISNGIHYISRRKSINLDIQT